MPYLTPDNYPIGYTCRVVFIPNGSEFAAIMRGAIEELTFAYNFTQYGALTPNEVANYFTETFDRFCFNEGSCRVIGELIPYAGAVNPYPEKWLACNGQSVLRSDFPDLFTVIGTTYGTSDITRFVLPDLRGRVIAGAGSALGVQTIALGESLGESVHTLTIPELASHSHTDTGHNHLTGNSLTALAVAPGELPVLAPNPVPTLTGNSSANLTMTGSSAAHNNMQPTLGINYFIVARD